MKNFARFAASGLERSGVLATLERLDRRPGTVRIIAYHRIDTPDAEPDLAPSLLSASPSEFRAHCALIARRYNAISIADLVAAHRGERDLPPRAVLLTFDDAYRDFADHAWPCLRAHGLPAALFVPTAFPDADGPGFWWDRLYAALRRTREPRLEAAGLAPLTLDGPDARRRAYRAVRARAKALPHAEAMSWLDGVIASLAELPSLHRVLGWDALRRLAADGVSVCPHGHAHALATRLEASALVTDLETSRRRLETELGALAASTVLAWPAYDCDASSAAVARGAGFELALGGRRGIVRLPLADPYDLMRVPSLGYGASLFRAQLRPSVAALGRFLVDRRAGLQA